MAHVVPRREPCKKCNNPVFLAERLQIDQNLYHRTCFRCARCDTVLTVGSFYATEKDNEYCCETCPDEEKSASAPKAESNRLSIAQRIALFERETSNVLKKSLSDEEKSKSLSRQSPANSEALTNFLSAQVETQEQEHVGSSSSDSDSDEEESLPPSITNSEGIPSISDKQVASSDDKNSLKETSEHSVVTKELINGEEDIKAIAHAAETNSESHEDGSGSDSAHLAVVESEKKEPKASISSDDPDLIDSLFEQLAEEAVNDPVLSRGEGKKKFEGVVEGETPGTVKNEILLKPEVLVKQQREGIVEIDQNVEKTATEVENQELTVNFDAKVQPSKNEIKKSEEKLETLEEATGNNDNAQVEVEIENKNENIKIEESLLENDEKSETDKVIEAPEIIIDDSQASPAALNASESPSPAQIPEPPSKPAEDDVEYPDDLNPFGDEDDENETEKSSSKPEKKQSLNPFGSCSEDEEEEVNQTSKRYSGTLPKPPRPPPPKAMTMKSPASKNPFGSDDDDEPQQMVKNSRTPVPTPRRNLLQSTTPEPSPRFSHASPGHSFKGSSSSLSSSTDGMSLRRKKKKAPAPPPPVVMNDSGSSSIIKTPSNTPRKKRPAPTPPMSSTPKKDQETKSNDTITSDYPPSTTEASETNESVGLDSYIENLPQQRRVIPLGESLIEEGSTTLPTETEEVTYRRKIVPLQTNDSLTDETLDNLERTKDNKEAENRQRQSRTSLVKGESTESDSMPYLNKSSHGKWKRRKGPAPALPGFASPQRRVLQMLPLQEIRQELEVIEVQQQGLEKQGVMLEKMIRERCEGSADNRTTEELLQSLPDTKNPKEVEELILQLFELVNEKNELFRRQAELMYLRRAHRLEEEQADVEYEIRTLMAQPEHNKTDTDKAREEALIARLVEIVQLRNEVVDNLDRDRLREAEEDQCIKERMKSHTAKMDEDYLNQTPTKLSKKEKKKLKEAKKSKNKKHDADKDLDTSEMKPETSEKKKKKKKFLF